MPTDEQLKARQKWMEEEWPRLAKAQEEAWKLFESLTEEQIEMLREEWKKRYPEEWEKHSNK